MTTIPQISMSLPESASELQATTPQLFQPVAVEPVAIVPEPATLMAEVNKLKQRPLSGTELALAKKWAQQLVPTDLDHLPDYINIGEKELQQLTVAARKMLAGISVAEMAQVREVAALVLKRVQEVDVNQLSPKAQKKLGLWEESLKDIIRRIERFFDHYKSVQGELDKQVAEIIKLRDLHVERKNQADAIGQEAKSSRNVLRIAVEACKIYLKESGYPFQKTLSDQIADDEKNAAEQGMMKDDKLAEQAAAYKGYLTIVENYMSTMEGAVVDAHQTYAALEMLEQNERVIAQSLHNLILFTIPAWQRLIAIAYIASMGEQAAEFVQSQMAVTNKLRKAAADMLKISAEEIAQLIQTSSFDDDSLQYMTTALVEALNTITVATEQATKARELNSEKGNQMIESISNAQIKFGRSGLVAAA